MFPSELERLMRGEQKGKGKGKGKQKEKKKKVKWFCGLCQVTLTEKKLKHSCGEMEEHIEEEKEEEEVE